MTDQSTMYHEKCEACGSAEWPDRDTAFVRVEFHDNDFGNPVSQALARMWNNIHENNSHLLPPSKLAITYQDMIESGLFLAALNRAVDAEYHYGPTEGVTRSLYLATSEEYRQIKMKNVTKPFRSITGDYLNITVSIHDNLDFVPVDGDNGESAWLNVTNGTVHIY